MGVRQGDNLSPLLFSIFVNDLESYLSERGCIPVQIDENDEINFWLKLLVLLYADDTLILAETADGLQLALDALSDYCDMWKLRINSIKTKIIIFQKRKSRTKPIFRLNNEIIEIVDEFRYLGVIFSYHGSFTKCRKALSESATKALFFVLKKTQQYSLDIDVSFRLFDAMVRSILTFACEIWGFENLKILEKVHLKFCKYVLRLNRSTPNYMVYGESGRQSLEIHIKCRMIKFWGKLIDSRGETMSSKMYLMLYNMRMVRGTTTKWLGHVKSILEECGMAEYWINHGQFSPQFLAESVRQRLSDQFLQKWRAECLTSPKALMYKHIKLELKAEPYLQNLPTNMRITLCRFRCSNHNLPIEIGRHTGIPREERFCTKCNSGKIGDELHTLLECPHYDKERKRLLPSFCWSNPNYRKLSRLFNSDTSVLRDVYKFIKLCTR